MNILTIFFNFRFKLIKDDSLVDMSKLWTRVIFKKRIIIHFYVNKIVSYLSFKTDKQENFIGTCQKCGHVIKIKAKNEVKNGQERESIRFFLNGELHTGIW